MAADGFTHSEIAARLVEGCLAHIAGNLLQDKMPIEARAITEVERADVGLRQGGQTVLYPIGASGVFLDLTGSTSTVWYMQGDYDRGLPAVEAVLKARYKVQQLSDEALSVAKQHRRAYKVELGNNRLAHVIVEYAERGAQIEKFTVRIDAQVRKQ